MQTSSQRILTTHAGSLARPAALRDLAPERVRFHVCWGSYHGPHTYDLPLHDFVGLIKYARLVGRERVIAGTDCGLGPRVGHPRIAWAKFEALVEGARLASRRLWSR